MDAVGIKTINLHGIYSHQNPEPGNAIVLQSDRGYHLHVLNEIDSSRKMDSREVFLPRHKIFLDTEVGTFIRTALLERVSAARTAKTG
jgi:hypothetical protein